LASKILIFQGDVIRENAPRTRGFTQKKCRRNKSLSDVERSENGTKSKVCAKVKRLFLIFQANLWFSQSALPELIKNARYFCIT